MTEAKVNTSTGNSSLRDVLELVLDKGIVIVGDIQIKIADVDLLTIKIRHWKWALTGGRMILIFRRKQRKKRFSKMKHC